MATLNGAKALGLDEQIGSLEIGKLADVIAINMSDIETQPLFNPLSQLVYTNSGSRVSHSWINGTLMLENRQPTTINLQDLSETTLAWQHKIGMKS
jgi:5-methylthioadenosine/S-adenosylhomocysteine deaminase